ncbi:hypothetical protein M0R45_006408 [Rubus argutus]|uniref:Uncharacterized protein n=1 Tax=Rubus argutus TaxID=59490 RepID=A0AAW1YQZ8_RUBAR
MDTAAARWREGSNGGAGQMRRWLCRCGLEEPIDAAGNDEEFDGSGCGNRRAGLCGCSWQRGLGGAELGFLGI